MSMNDLGYSRCGSRRGIRLHPCKRISIKTLRARFACLVRLLSRWRRAYGRAFRAIRRGICRERSHNPASVLNSRSKRDGRFNSSSRKPLVRETNYVRSNSFYSEAIKECLEFIKRNSVSADESQPLHLEEEQGHQVRFPLECNRSPFHHDRIPPNTIFLPKIA